VAGSALYFADTRMKTEDWWFLGFPAVWNVVMLYLAVFPVEAWIGFLFVMAFVASMFLPVPFVHPFRVNRFRALTVAMLVAWAIAAIWAVAAAFQVGIVPKIVLLLTGGYFLSLGMLRGKPGDPSTGEKTQA
ncbi:MAG: phosphatidylcholine synthase, partial [Beijerinckiaceae bacterium]